MNREEYEARRAEIYAQLAELKEQYIHDNTDIEPGSVVMAAGEKCILKEYKVTNGQIYPILVKLRNKNAKVHVSANAKIVKV